MFNAVVVVRWNTVASGDEGENEAPNATMDNRRMTRKLIIVLIYQLEEIDFTFCYKTRDDNNEEIFNKIIKLLCEKIWTVVA